ncbi:MAG: amino acid ABC transporter permease [Fusobacteriaceae bacterium]|nr:amino acid ABC transporter permease [Fusobacteriaceae bacterium]MBP6323020.1 amino acid ABC transporter permease [Fusobacteriaceae bacterium]MBP9509551.1 amino acid ABC transporter permease [Fusobacteriaceae bacterium]
MINIWFYILKGVNMTLLIFGLTAILGIPLGMSLALCGTSRKLWLKKIIGFYTWLFRGTPLMLQLFFVYYGLPSFGIVLEPVTAAVITFVINYGAYFSEIFRGSLLSIEDGQYEASKVLGMNYYQTMTRIIIPQSLRVAIPGIGNELLGLIKNTSLISTIGVGEILRNSREIVTREFTIIPFLVCGLIYLILSTGIEIYLKSLERKVGI